MLSIFGVSIVLYFIKILSGSRKLLVLFAYKITNYLRSLVVRYLHQHRKGVSSITGGPIVDFEFFHQFPVEFRRLYNFNSN